jgi:23S rRNA (cytosine1962-C5)-methyltransferase
MSNPSELPVVRLRTERKNWHPWIFQKMVDRPPRIPPGSVVDVVDRTGNFVGRGFYNGHSRIALRILTADPTEAIDEEFFRRSISRAVALRRDWLQLDKITNAYRLIHSEGDGLSGLVVDRFGETIVIEFFSAGMFKFREVIRTIFAELFPNSQFYWFAEEHVAKQESFDCYPQPLPTPNVISENGVKFRVAPGSKHKTGFFVDQRDNRQFVAQLAQGKSLLDLCCNTGGFAVSAKVLGATEVQGVDLDEQAIELAKQNARLNGVEIKFTQADIFAWLRDILPLGRRWDMVVLDPAKMTRDRESLPLALKKYLDMNRLSLQAVKAGGIFVTCSCTGLVSEEMFLDVVRRAAWQANRPVQILKISGAGGDHPYLAHAEESRYLKCVVCRVIEDKITSPREPHSPPEPTSEDDR